MKDIAFVHQDDFDGVEMNSISLPSTVIQGEIDERHRFQKSMKDIAFLG